MISELFVLFNKNGRSLVSHRFGDSGLYYKLPRLFCLGPWINQQVGTDGPTVINPLF